MKAKYTFKKVKSKADMIKLQTNNIVIKQFTNTDYGENYENLVGKSFNIDLVDCYDLNALKLVGAEDHKSQFTEELNKQWSEEAKYLLGSNHISDTTHLIALSTDKPITIVNQNNETFDEFYSRMTSTKNIFTNTNSKVKFDFSQFSRDISVSTNPITSSGSRIAVPFSITAEGTTSNANSYAFANTSSSSQTWALESTQNFLEDSTSFNYVSAYTYEYHLKNIHPSFKNATFYNLTTMFAYCPLLHELLLPKKVVNFQGYIYSNCSFSYVDFSGLYTDKLLTNSSIVSGSYFTSSNIPYIELNSHRFYSYYLGPKESTSIGIVNIKSPLKLVSPVSNSPIELSDDYSYMSSSYGLFCTLTKLYTVVACPARYIYAGTNIVRTDKDSNLSYFCSSNSYPASDGYEWWVDYVSSPTAYVKNITKTTYTFNNDITTVYNPDTVTMDFDILQKADDYEHDFKVKEITDIYWAYQTNTSYTVKQNMDDVTVEISSDDPSKLRVSCHCIDLADDVVASLNIKQLNVNYIAEIDGYEFHGSTIVDLTLNYTFTIDEDVDVDVELLLDDDTVIEEPEVETDTESDVTPDEELPEDEAITE